MGSRGGQQAVDSTLRSTVTRLVPVAAIQPDRPHGLVLCFSALHTVTPQSERSPLELLTHQRDDRSFVQRKLGLDSLKGRTVLPGHLDDSGHVCSIKSADWF